MMRQGKHQHRVLLMLLPLLLLVTCLSVSNGKKQDDESAKAETRQPGQPEVWRIRDALSCRPTAGEIYRVEEALFPYEISHYKDLLICGKKERAMAGCAELKELSNTILCVFPKREDMHLSLHRASAYIEQGGKMLTDAELRQDPGFDGHDLLREDLLRYYRAFEKFTNKSGEGDIAQEESFWKGFLLPKLAVHPVLVLITAFEVDYIDLVVSHELLHAQFLHDPGYRQAVSTFWASRVPGAERRRISRRLAEVYPTIENLNMPVRSEGEHALARRILLNEFQAYTLQIPGGQHLQDLLDLTTPYRAGLRQYLVDCGVPPIRFGANKHLPQKSTATTLPSPLSLTRQDSQQLLPSLP